MEADPRQRTALHLGAAVARRERAARQMGARGRRHARQDDDDVDARVDPRARRTRSRLPDRRRAAEFRHVGAAGRQRVLRHRGRRIRHRVLRQALEVRPLPAAHGDPQQSRIRSRRHLPRPRRDRDAVPPPRPHGAAVGAARSSTREEASLARVLARGCWSRGRALRRRRARAAGRRLDAGMADRARRQGHARQRAAGRSALAGGRAAARPPQSAERAGRARRGAPRRRPGRRRASRRSRSSAASSAGSKCAAPRAASPSTTTSRIIRRRSRRRIDGLRRGASATRASSRCSSRARTR